MWPSPTIRRIFGENHFGAGLTFSPVNRHPITLPDPELVAAIIENRVHPFLHSWKLDSPCAAGELASLIECQTPKAGSAFAERESCYSFRQSDDKIKPRK